MAINFPVTTGEATDGSFTHTASGITWAWDGTTWNAQGVTGTYSLPTASATVLGGIKVGSNLTIAGDGTLAAQTGASVNCFSTIQVSGQNNVVADSNNDTLTFAAGTNVTLATNNSSDTITINAAGGALTIQEEGVDLATDATTLNFVGAGVTASGTGATKTITITGGGGSGLQARTTANAVTSATHGINAAENIQITAAKTYALQKIQTSAAAWVTLYVSAAARTADASRNETTDPLPGSGVIAEVITSDGAIQNITPGTLGWNDDSTPTTDAYLKVVNKSGSAQPITVTLHFVALEA
tara:strand:- start:394 stop:1290 length:897 start_codon:yes stop_codon:yes gene_type:complete